MATQEQKNVLDENIAEQPLAESMFSQQPSSPGDSLAPGADEELSAHDVFAGDEDFYKLLEDYAEDSAGNMGASETLFFTISESPEPFPTTLVVASVITVVVVGIGLLFYFKKPR